MGPKVYINGKFVGKHDEGQEGWNKPFSFDITEFLAESPAEYLLAVRVFDPLSAGGIWKPVFLRYVDENK